MGLQKVTFEGGNVTSQIDADLYHHLFSGKVGIIYGLKEECRYTLSNNTITFSDGYVSVYGRIVYIENQTSIGVTPDSSKMGYVVLGVNTQTNEVSIYIKELSGAYPTLTQTNLISTSGLYEFPLCAYSKTTTSVEINSFFVRDYIIRDTQYVEDVRTELHEKYLPYSRTITKVSNGVYSLSGTGSYELMQVILFVVISSNTVVTFPGDLLFIGTGSNKTVSYRYGNADYSLGVAYQDGVLTFTCGSTLHEITKVFMKK